MGGQAGGGQVTAGTAGGLHVSLSDRVAVVAGTHTDLNVATAATLAMRRARVLLLVSPSSAPSRGPDTIDRWGGRILQHATDLSDPAAIQSASRIGAESLGRANLLVFSWIGTRLNEDMTGLRNITTAFRPQLVAAQAYGVVDIVTAAPRNAGASAERELRAEFGNLGVRVTTLELDSVADERQSTTMGIPARNGFAAELSPWDVADVITFVISRSEHVSVPRLMVIPVTRP